MNSKNYNIVVLGISCFEGMAGSKRVRNLIEPLITRNLIEVNYLIFKSEIIKEINGAGNTEITDHINYKIIGYNKSNILTIFSFFFKGFVYLIKFKKSKYKNIVYNYGGPNILNFPFIFFAKLIGYKIISDIVEDDRYEPAVNFINKIKIKSSLYLLKLSKFYVDYFIGISKHLYNRLQYYSKGKVPVALISISVNLSLFKVLSEKDKEHNDIKLLYSGSFNEKDGLIYLIDAFDLVCKKYDNLTLILTGFGTEYDKNRVISYINQSEYKSKIDFKGFLDNNDYFTLLYQCDILCMTRINSNHANTGFPFKLGEFLSTGKAVIATKVSDVSEYLENDKNAVLIKPNSVEEIANAILYLIENPDKAKAIGIEGYKTACNYFDSEKVSMKLLSILECI